MDKQKIDNLPLEWVRVFEAAGRCGSFTAAAQECGLTQAAVSQRIRNLEDRIGAALFSRQARGVTLTVDGEAWLPYVSAALQALNRSADELFGAPLKKLVISSSSSVSQLWIVPRLARLNHTANYQISITTINIEGDFAKTNAAIEVRYGRGHWPGVQSVRLYPETLSPVAAPALLKKAGRWQDLPLIAVSGPRAGWQEWAAQNEDASLPIPQFRFDTFSNALAAAKAGVGVMLGSLPLCAAELETGVLRQVSKQVMKPDASYYLIRKARLGRRQWEALVEQLTVG